MKGAYYNEIDPFAAQWLRNLTKANLIAPGEVDERSIREVQPEDLRGFDQVHLFAGIGGWSLALRLAGWGDDRPVWTGSCPCQPFSTAGAGGGFDDERHLWPEMYRLARELRPSTILGEQVASPDALSWLDLVFGDLEGQDYACGAADLCSAGVGAPNIRQRIYWMAHAMPAGRSEGRPGTGRGQATGGGVSGRLGDTHRQGWQGWQGERGDDGAELAPAERAGGKPGGVGDASSTRSGRDARAIPGSQGEGQSQRHATGSLADQLVPSGHHRGMADAVERPQAGGIARPILGAVPRGYGEGYAHFWSDADWLPCRDGKSRPVEPGTFPLATGVPARVGRLRAYGNAINPEVAAEFIRATQEAFELKELLS